MGRVILSNFIEKKKVLNFRELRTLIISSIAIDTNVHFHKCHNLESVKYLILN